MRINKLLGIQLKVVLYISILALTLGALGAPVGVALADEPDKTSIETATEEITTEMLRSLFDQLNASSDAQATFARLSPAEQTAVTNAMESGVTGSYTTMYTVADSDDDGVCNYHSHRVYHKVPVIGSLN